MKRDDLRLFMSQGRLVALAIFIRLSNLTLKLVVCEGLIFTDIICLHLRNSVDIVLKESCLLTNSLAPNYEIMRMFGELSTTI